MSGKNQTSTSNSSQSYTPTGINQLQDIWNKVQGVASTPYTPYGGQLTAGLDPTQQAGINTINNAQGTAQPYYDQATQYANQAAAPISAAQIQNYQSPYTQQVVNAAQNQFNDSNAQQQQQVVGNAALQGALGGDRVGVAQAELARQQKLAQDPTIAGLYNQGYTQALGAAQQDRAAQGQAAYSLGSLGSAAQNTAISGGNAQLGAGAVGQGTTQAGLSAQYQQYLQAQAFPYQQAQFLSSYGLPSVTAQGGNQTGTSQTTQPGPSPWGQVAGIGLTAASFLKDGGRVRGYASGGSPMSAENFISIPSFIPQGNAPQSQAPQISPMQASSFKPQAMTMPSAQSLSGAMGGIGNLYNSYKLGDDGLGNWNDPSWDGGTPLSGGADIGGAGGGIGRAANGGRINRASGGAVSPSPFGVIQGYDDGGSVPFDQRWADVDAANSDFNRPASVASPYPVLNSDTLGLGKPVDWSPAQQNAPSLVANGATPQSITAADLPPQMANAEPPLGQPSSPMSYAATTDDTSGATTDLSAQSKQPDQASSGLLGLGLSKEARMGLLSAGLGALASRSPFALNAIGEGGLQGVNTYNQLTKQGQDQANKQQEIGLRAKQLAQTASQFAQTFGLQQQNAQRADLQPVKIGQTAMGQDIFAVRDPKSGGYKIIDSKTGQPIEPGSTTASASGTEESQTTGPEFLKTIDPQIANVVKAIDEGRMQAPSGMMLRTPYGQTIQRALSQYNPQFDWVNPQARLKTRQDFTSGKSAQNITSFNTAIQHLDTLDKSVDDLNNTNFPYWNKLANAVSSSYDPQFQSAAKKFDTAKTAVTDELTRAFRGSGGNVHDIVEWEKNLNKADSPSALHTAVKQAIELLNGRIESVADQYNRGMGTMRDPLTLLSPKAQNAVKRMQGIGSPEPAPQISPSTQGNAASDPLSGARDAIARGAPRDAVIKRLNAAGIDASGL